MRHLLPLIFALLTMSPMALAQDAPSDQIPLIQVMSDQEAQALRADLQTLATAMGIEQGATNTSTATAQENIQENTTMANVADRALTLVNGLVAQLSTTLETMAPELWRVMIKQQYAKAVTNLVVPIGLFFAALAYWLTFRNRVHEIINKLSEGSLDKVRDRGDSNESVKQELSSIGLAFGSWLPIAFMCIFASWSFNRIADSAALLINPEYYAVRDIMLMLLNPSGIQ